MNAARFKNGTLPRPLTPDDSLASRLRLASASRRALPRQRRVAIAAVALLFAIGCNTTEKSSRPATSPKAPDYFQGCVQLRDVPLGVVCDGRVVFNLCSSEGLCKSRASAGAFLVTAQTAPGLMSKPLVDVPARMFKDTPLFTKQIQDASGKPVVIVERVKGPPGQMFKNGICSRPALDRFAARCDALLGAVIDDKLNLLAFRNIEATIAVENIPLTVAERPFDTPPDCADVNVERGDLTMGIEAPIKGARLSCPQANLRWTTTQSLKSAMGMLHTPLPGGGMTNKRVPCEIEGVASNCAQWRGKSDGPEPDARLLEGFVKVRERVLFARCEWIATGPGIPQPCDQIFNVVESNVEAK